MVKGIAILLVIIGHTAKGFGLLIPVISSFHMPLFFIVSGYFYKEKNFFDLLKRDSKSLLLPYLLVSVLFIIYGIVTGIWQHNPDKAVFWIDAFLKAGKDECAIGPLWFLLAMFWCRLFYNLLFRLVKKITINPAIYMVFISYPILLITTFTPPHSQSINYLCIMHGMTGMFYFSLGYLAKEYRQRFVLPKKNHCFVLLAFFTACFSIAHSLGTSLIFFKHYAVYTVLASVSSTYLIYKFCQKFRPENKNILVWYGRLSLVVFCMHTIIFRIVPIERVLESGLNISNLYLNSFLVTLFHIIISILFCIISERSRVLSYLFNIKSSKNVPISNNLSI